MARFLFSESCHFFDADFRNAPRVQRLLCFVRRSRVRHLLDRNTVHNSAASLLADFLSPYSALCLPLFCVVRGHQPKGPLHHLSFLDCDLTYNRIVQGTKWLSILFSSAVGTLRKHLLRLQVEMPLRHNACANIPPLCAIFRFENMFLHRTYMY